MNDSAPAGLLARLAIPLGVLAVLLLLGTGATAFTRLQPGEDPPVEDTAPSTEPSPAVSLARVVPRFPDPQVISGDSRSNVTFQVPSTEEHWTKLPAGTGLRTYYGEGGSWMDLRWTGEYRSGVCGPDSNRASVGIQPFDGNSQSMEEVHDLWAPRWAESLVWTNAGGILPDDIDMKHSYGSWRWVTRDQEFELLSGDTGLLSVAVATGPLRDGCLPPRAEVQVLTVDTGDSATSVILKRDLDVPTSLSDQRAEDILSTVQPQVAPED